ncbi:MAG TPA: hypothetical protein VEX64_02905 [Pyrinomonadaceae bacterium]|nr:hypothetical protein [Pyrinomonadaceae bacterium]
MQQTNYLDLPNCLRLSNGEIEVVVATDIGPRILFYGFAGGENILGEHPHAAVSTPLGEWKPYGGHRLWIAPENMPNSYAPDNSPVEYSSDENENSIRLVQPPEPVTMTQKEIILKLEATGTDLTLEHKITNLGDAQIEIAPWALTIMRGGGEAVIPNEPFAPYSGENLLPVRSLAVWSYTDFSDSRWSFEKNYIRLRTDDNKHEPQKIGVLNHQGWAAYIWQELLFIKRYDSIENALYPDFNCNTELYTAGSFIEVESLAPLQSVAPGESAMHTERWQLFSNTSLDNVINADSAEPAQIPQR